MIIIKSYLKKIKFTGYTLAIFLFSLIFLNIFMSGIFYCGDYLKQYAREIYGKYHYCVYGVDKSVAQDIVNEKSSYNSALFQSKISNDRYYVYCETDYLELAGMNIIEGSFPESGNQVMCNKSYMYGLGYGDNEIVGKKVIIDEEEYIVSGIADWQEYNDLDISGGLFVFNLRYNEEKKDEETGEQDNDTENYKPYYNVIIENRDDNFLNAKNYIIDKYDLLKSKVGINVDYLLLSYRTETDKPSGILKLGYYIYAFILLTIVFLTFGVLMLSCNQINKINSVYRRLGINEKVLCWELIKCLLILLTIAFIVTNLVSVILDDMIFGNVKYVKICIIAQLITYVLPVIFMMVFVVRRHLCNIYSDKRIKKISSIRKNSNLNIKNNIYIQLSKNINFMGKGQYIVTLMASALVGVIFICLLFYAKIICNKLIDINDFEYKLTYDGGYDVQTNEYSNTLDKMRDEIGRVEGCYFVPVCVDLHQDAIIEKSQVNKKYWECMEKYNVNIKEQLLTNSRYINVKVITVGLEDYYCEFFGIKKKDFNRLTESDCIVIRDVDIDNVGTIDNGIKANSKINVYYHDDFEFVSRDLNVKYVYDNMDMKLNDAQNNIVVIVKDELLQKMNVYAYPKTIYIKCPADKKNEVLNIIKGNQYIDVTDIGSFNDMVKNINKVIWCSALFVSISIVIFLIINIWVIMKTREEEMKKIRNMLKVFGVSDKKIIFIFLFDTCKIFISGFLLSVAISTVLCYNLAKNKMALGIYIKYFIPYDLYAFLLMGIIVLTGIFGIQVKRYLTNINLMQELKVETSLL